jgi:hypothetical protein
MRPVQDLPQRRRFSLPSLRGWFSIILISFSAGTLSEVLAAASMTPIPVTGWNRDVVVESTASGPPFTAYAAEINAGEGKVFYQSGLPGFAWGLPPSGLFLSMLGDNTLFQIPPYTANNALVLSPGTGLTSGTLTLTAPATFARIAVLAHSANGTNSTGTLTVNFADGTSLATTYFTPDWFNGTTNVAWFGNGRILLTTGADDGGLENPRFYQTTVNIALLAGATNKPIASLTFGKSVARSTIIYAVSGQLAANAGPIGVTGWNRDLMVENTAAGPPYTATAVELNPGEGLAFYQNGLSGKNFGLPRTGAFESAVDGTLFQFQPYAGNNALVMSSATALTRATLTLTNPAAYNVISVIANSAAGGGAPALTLNFSDGSTFVTNYNAQDWFNNAGFAVNGFERISLSSGAVTGAPDNPRFYQTSVDLVALFGATNKLLSSVTFDKATGAGATAVYGISGVRVGQTNGGFALATVTNLPAAGVGSRSATLGGTVLGTGGDTPEVFIYYGTSDGGTNPVNWGQRVFLGTRTGAFAQPISGLTPGTAYFYRSVAINAAGVSWATQAQAFNTSTPSLAVITNLPAANITANSALLSGQVLSNGGDAPGVTVYYGPSNGGNNPAAWAHSLYLGTQVGRFGQPGGGLTPNTTIYFTSAGTNGAGTAWASSAQSFVTLASNPPPTPLVPVLTYRTDNARTGQNTNETALTLANVNSNTFGKVFSYTLDGYMAAQPLVLPNVSIPGQGTHNVVYAVTEHDSVYAFDADTIGGSGTPLWQVSLINPGAGIYTLNASADLVSWASGFDGNDLGITGTPVIDPVTGTLYVLAMTKEVVNNVTNFYNRLHALDVATGAEKFGGPVLIQGTVPGMGDGHDSNGNVPFVHLLHHNREALLLNNGKVYVAFTGHFDYPPYHGWVFAYNAYTLAQTGIYNANANGSGGGFWQAGCGPAADSAGNIYLESGNGNFDGTNQVFGNSVLKLSTTNGLSLADYFTPYNQLDLNLRDIDVGSAGQIVLPDSVGSAAHPRLLLAGSKAGTAYLLDRDNMGHFNAASDSQIVQSLTGVGGMWNTPGYFNGMVYFAGSGSPLKAYTIANGLINATPVGQSVSSIGYPGASPCFSANGTTNAIVWALQTSGSPNSPAILHAYNATNVAIELYNSSQNLSRDNPGPAVKFTVPAIANGKVYVPAINMLSVFGNAVFLAAPVIAPNGGIFTNSVLVTLSESTPGATMHYTLDGSTPTTNSPLYTGPFTVAASGAVKVVATIPGSPDSPVASATFYNSAALGSGSGLIGQYFTNTTLTGTPLVRTDPVVDFNWNTTPPDPSIGSVNYSVRWYGMVQPVFDESYTFSTTTDDGVRLSVNGQLLIDHWAPQSPTTWTGSISLRAQQLYSIQMEYFQAQGGAVAQLAWSSPSTASAIIPQSQLYPITSFPPVSFTGRNYFTNHIFSMEATGLAGGNYAFQASTDLVHWSSLATNLAPSNVFNLIDPAATNFPYRFYRAIGQP